MFCLVVVILGICVGLTVCLDSFGAISVVVWWFVDLVKRGFYGFWICGFVLFWWCC